MQDHLWESCGSVVSPDDLCRSLICLHRLSGSSVFSSGREDLRCRRLMLVSCHLCDVITWWEQKLSALKIVILSNKEKEVLEEQNDGIRQEMVQNVKLGGHQTCLSINRLWHELCDMLRRLVGTIAPGHHDCSIQE
ncbi:uncharacterized protein TNCV_4702531 [Trichonephila clavipes]|nr:uncharacterized protein TNCV_4702531 [Trichonephila clavipes]